MLADVLRKCGEFGPALLIVSFVVVALAVTHAVTAIRGRGDASAWRQDLLPLGEVAQMLGLGFGPYILSVFTQYVFGGDTGVRWSLLAVPAGAHLIAAVLLFSALGPFKRSMDRVKEWEARH